MICSSDRNAWSRRVDLSCSAAIIFVIMTCQFDFSINSVKSSPRRTMRKFAILTSRVFLFSLAVLLFGGCSGLEKADSEQSRSSASASYGDRTALDEYVAKPDPNYNFHLVNSIPGADQTTFILEMTSQAWLTTNEVD